MTSSKKGAGDQLITVDAGKLSLGLKTAFEGVALIFDSLGANAGFDVVGREEPQGRKPAAKSKSKVQQEEPADPVQEVEDETETTPNTSGGDDSPVTDNGPAAEDDSAVDTPDSSDEAAEAMEDEGQETVPDISIDDVTKIIVQKIKQDRGNNQKIGQILKTYGAVKVGELDPKKYEAFLTDLAAL